MKPIFIITLMLIWASMYTVTAQEIKTYPIPSYNVVTYGLTNFMEQGLGGKCQLSKGNRKLIITSSGGSSCPAQIWIFSLDRLDILGPYTLNPGETLIVEIDEREWGVTSESACQVTLSVWIEEISDPPGKGVIHNSISDFLK